MEPQVERIIRDLQDIFGDRRGVNETKSYRRGKNEEMTSLSELPVYPIPGKYIVLAPSASFLPKRWHIESFVGLAERLLTATDYHVVVLAGPDDTFCEAFDKISSSKLLNLQGKTTLKESMMILARADLSVGNDSGMNHIAEAYEVPVITIFGPTDPLFGFVPHGKKSAFLSKDLWCKPCSTTGKSPCYRKEHYCMNLITVDEVMEKVQKVLA
jgi:heptosyltransferase-2